MNPKTDDLKKLFVNCFPLWLTYIEFSYKIDLWSWKVGSWTWSTIYISQNHQFNDTYCDRTLACVYYEELVTKVDVAQVPFVENWCKEQQHKKWKLKPLIQPVLVINQVFLFFFIFPNFFTCFWRYVVGMCWGNQKRDDLTGKMERFASPRPARQAVGFSRICSKIGELH